jgi:LysM repeat protein
MFKTSWKLLLSILLAGALLTACSRTIPQETTAPTATTSDNIPFPLPATEDPMKNIQMIATQTAAAAEETPAQPKGESITVVPVATEIEINQAPLDYATPTPGRPTTYTIHKGEYPYCLARRFNVDPATLLSINGLGVGSLLSPGQTLTIPSTGSWSGGSRALKSHPTTYTVKSGDTIYTVACAFGDVDPNTLIAANGLTSPYTLKVGSVIQIP